MSRDRPATCVVCGVSFLAFNRQHIYCKGCQRARILEKQHAYNARKQAERTSVYIYGLYDPDTDVLCYIGKTNNPSVRLWQHVEHAHSRRLRDWVAALARRGKKPIMRILEETTADCWREREQAWIATIAMSPYRLNRR